MQSRSNGNWHFSWTFMSFSLTAMLWHRSRFCHATKHLSQLRYTYQSRFLLKPFYKRQVTWMSIWLLILPALFVFLTEIIIERMAWVRNEDKCTLLTRILHWRWCIASRKIYDVMWIIFGHCDVTVWYNNTTVQYQWN